MTTAPLVWEVPDIRKDVNKAVVRHTKPATKFCVIEIVRRLRNESATTTIATRSSSIKNDIRIGSPNSVASSGSVYCPPMTK